MPPWVARSIFKKVLSVVSCTFAVCVATPLALAQHTAGHASAGVVHVSPPPVFHVPSAAPIVHAPATYTPSFAHAISAGPSAGALGTWGFRPPRRPIRPFPPVLVVYESPFFLGGTFGGWNSCWWTTCDLLWSWTLGSTTVSSPGPTSYVSQVYETPVYVYGEERVDLPQLFLKDGTTLNVTDYWVVDGQLHFTMIEEDGKAEHEIPFEALDLQTTVDVNAGRGFRFMLRNEPFEQYWRDHPEGPPPSATPPRQ